jgi:hypothetical protein
MDRDFLRFKDLQHPDMGETLGRACSQDKGDFGRFRGWREGRWRLNLPRRGAPLFFLLYFQKTESACQFISGDILPSPWEWLVLGAIFHQAHIIMQKKSKWGKIFLNGIEIKKSSMD